MLPINSTELNGSGTDADGMIIRFEWNILAYFSQVSQYGSSSYSTATAKFNNLAEGMYW